MNHAQRGAYVNDLREESSRLGGWYPCGLGDGSDEEGRFVYFHMYEHLDGRRATVWYPSGYCDNPDLAEQLRLAAEREPPVKIPLQTRLIFGFVRWACRLISGMARRSSQQPGEPEL